MKPPKKDKFTLLIFALIFVIMCFLILYMFFQDQLISFVSKSFEKTLYINEACCKNETILADSDGNYYDYIELYNNSSSPLSLNNYGLSDDSKKPYKYTFVNTIIPANDSIIVFATKKGTNPDTLYTGFGLDKDIENKLYLSSPSGKLIDTLAIPVLPTDIAYGHVTNGNKKTSMLFPSPLQPNETTGIFIDIEEPSFSLASGFYSSDTQLQLSTTDSDLKIYYTLDCTSPTVDSLLYTETIPLLDISEQANVFRSYKNITSDYSTKIPEEPVDKSTVVKAVACDQDGNFSEIVTSTYFINYGEKEKYHNHMIISLTTAPANLFDDTYGIYVTGSAYDKWYADGKQGSAPTLNYEQRGDASERVANLEIFDSNHSLVVNQSIGIRIQGASARQYSTKRFSLYSRDDYGTDNYFLYDFFENDIQSHSLVLRTNGVDAFVQKAIDGENVATQNAIPVSVFLEGEYWG